MDKEKRRTLTVLATVATIVLMLWLWSETTPRSADETPTADPGYITACVLNRGYDNLRLRVWINRGIVDDKLIAPDKVGCGGMQVYAGVFEVSVACDGNAIVSSERVTVTAGQFVDLPAPGRAYICT